MLYVHTDSLKILPFLKNIFIPCGADTICEVVLVQLDHLVLLSQINNETK